MIAKEIITKDPLDAVKSIAKGAILNNPAVSIFKRTY